MQHKTLQKLCDAKTLQKGHMESTSAAAHILGKGVLTLRTNICLQISSTVKDKKAERSYNTSKKTPQRCENEMRQNKV